jgi:hypothetical protein
MPAVVFWTVLLAIFWWYVSAYDFQESMATPSGDAQWPADSRIDAALGRDTILFFLHPKCPCSSASLAEMERLLIPPDGEPGSLPQVVVVATLPDTDSPEWLNTRTMDQARRLPGVTLYLDRDGREAARFGATASGTVMWFDAQGRRLYAGGITFARGHEGANVGRDRLAMLIHGSRNAEEGIPAFGCTLCLPQ